MWALKGGLDQRREVRIASSYTLTTGVIELYYELGLPCNEEGIYITTDAGNSWSISTTTGRPYITCNPTSGTGSGFVTVNCSQTTGGGTITITSGAPTAYVDVYNGISCL